MKYKVVIAKRAQRGLNRINSQYKPRILVALVGLASDPYLGKKLAGEYKEQRSYEVWPYRIIYEIYKKKLVVLVIRIRHRQGVYK